MNRRQAAVRGYAAFATVVGGITTVAYAAMGDQTTTIIVAGGTVANWLIYRWPRAQIKIATLPPWRYIRD